MQRYQLENPHIIVIKISCVETCNLSPQSGLQTHALGSEIRLKLKDNQWKMPWSVCVVKTAHCNMFVEAELGDAAEPEPADSDDLDEEAISILQ